MTADQMVHIGNQHRANNEPNKALACYARAFVLDRHNVHAFNNYGNVLRECGDPAGAVPFLQRAVQLDQQSASAAFNLSVAYLLQGDYARGWPQYETRWNFEHMAGTLPQFEQPRWTGQDIQDKTVFVVTEQGLGDNIQFVRFLGDVLAQQARVIFSVPDSLISLFDKSSDRVTLVRSGQVPEQFDYWIPLMSLPGVLGVTLDNLPKNLFYLKVAVEKQNFWRDVLGPKRRLRVGFCYSGRRDAWVNRYKSMPLTAMLDLISRNPNYDWINLQMDATDQDLDQIRSAGCHVYNDRVNDMAHTAGLVHHLDVIISVDTAVAHLSAAMGRPTWIPLSCFAVDWRWLLDRNDSPWYPSARLFRQSAIDDWAPVTDQLHKFLAVFKI
jgi:tetratricopeptide (TPR) repeat protein